MLDPTPPTPNLSNILVVFTTDVQLQPVPGEPLEGDQALHVVLTSLIGLTEGRDIKKLTVVVVLG